MNDFPPMPDPTWMMPTGLAGKFDIPGAFTAQQMREYVEADRAQRQAVQEPVAIVAVTPNGGATVGWYPGHIAKHNDKLYAAPPPAQPDQAAEIAALREALNLFVKSAFPVAAEINPRGHNWSEAYLDEALTNAREVLAQAMQPKPDTV